MRNVSAALHLALAVSLLLLPAACVISREHAPHGDIRALQAVAMLELVGQPEDALLLEARRPEDPTFAAVFDEVIQALRRSPC